MSGYTDDGYPYLPGVNCVTCGRFVGRDGTISIEHFEMSTQIASADGECRRCINARNKQVKDTQP